MMNKKGKGEGLVWTLVVVVAFVAVMGTLNYFGVFKAQQSGLTGNVVTNPATGGVGTATVPSSAYCPVNPSITTAFTDALNSGTAVTPVLNYRVNGQYTGTTAPTVRSTVQILANASGYLSKVLPEQKIDCNSNLVTDSLYAYANATLTYYSDNGVSVLSISQNETVKASGLTYNWKLHFQGTDKKSTGKQLLIVELSVPANVSSVSLSGGQVVSVPNGYASQLTNGYKSAFLLPALTGNMYNDYTLSVTEASSKVVTGTVYTTIYSVEPFVETDGTFSDTGLAFNSLNVAKYHDSQTKNFIIN